MVKVFSLKVNGNCRLSNNFLVKEFRCKDGSDKILIDTSLIYILQELRDRIGQPIIINSAYRTPAYNTQCGGAKNSYHLKGMACDIRCNNIAPKELAKIAESMNIKGIGLYDTFIHIDTRATKYYWQQINKKNIQTNTFMG